MNTVSPVKPASWSTVAIGLIAGAVGAAAAMAHEQARAATPVCLRDGRPTVKQHAGNMRWPTTFDPIACDHAHQVPSR